MGSIFALASNNADDDVVSLIKTEYQRGWWMEKIRRRASRTAAVGSFASITHPAIHSRSFQANLKRFSVASYVPAAKKSSISPQILIVCPGCGMSGARANDRLARMKCAYTKMGTALSINSTRFTSFAEAHTPKVKSLQRKTL